MKRIKVKPKCPNPLFESWLEAWKEDAKSRGSEMQYCLSKALNSLRKFPVQLKSGRECQVLQYFGPKLCAMLDKKLAEYQAGNINPTPYSKNPIAVVCNDRILPTNNKENARNTQAVKRPKKSKADDQPAKKIKTPNAKDGKIVAKRNTGTYFPAWRSGGYAILLTLYEKSSEPDYLGFMNKADLQADAQKYCDGSLKKAEPGNRYTAWSSMATLIERGLVVNKNKPAKYRLTDAGFAVAMRLSEVAKDDCASGSSSQFCSSSKSSGSNERAGVSQEVKDFGDSDEDIQILPLDNDKNLSNKNTRQKIIINHSKILDINQRTVAMRLSEVAKNDCASGSSSQFCSSSKSSGSNERAGVSQEVKDFGDSDEDIQILPLDNDKNLLNKNTRQKIIINHSKILDINQRTDSQKSATSEDDRSLVFRPETFDIILLVDDRETAGAKTRPKDDITLAELMESKVKFEVRNLKIGDFTWIARCRKSGEELILPYIVERKRMDDLGGSIKDGRYHEQKFRLKKSGVQNVTYLIEHHGNNQFAGLPLTTLFQAATNTLIQDGFTVKYTKSHRESMFYLATLTVLLTKIYRGKTLVACKKEDLTPSTTTDNVIQLMVFKDFNKAAAKVKVFKAKEMFIRHLIQLNGLSVEKALAIVDFYQTPTALRKAFKKSGSSGENLLSSVQFGSTKRQLGPALSKTLHQFYTRKDF